ncbi:hypothetical protein [Halococcus sp. PRR34]|uniref:hypothetical protein n=1 Tax=Halococcus sp. PRR34 TaxID=3020830 RepID=UPI00236207B4|nr:hypothetical protein [Halococcus sp. PRR34]
MNVSNSVKLRDGSGNEVEIEITATTNNGEQAVGWVEDIEAAVEDALPEEWY